MKDFCMLSLLLLSSAACTLPFFLLASLRDKMLDWRAFLANLIQLLWCSSIYAVFWRK